VIGRAEVMDAAQDAFISSTFWTERSGYAAALATLDKMARYDVPAHLKRAGERINDGWQDIAAEAGLDIRISGIPPLTHIHFEHEEDRSVQTLYTDRMLDRGFLVGSAVYTTFAYTDAIIDHFLKASLDSFVEIKHVLDRNGLEEALPHGAKHAGFQRLTDAPS
jgi:glutamate-1-semialdehyde aminotransferase